MKKILYLIFTINYSFINSQIPGCTDPLASNYNSSANKNDGSCIYPNTTISLIQSFNLSDSARETSGLIFYNNSFWTHNDDNDTRLYGFNQNGITNSKINLNNISNIDWEDLTQDETHIYIGDFGNNVSGNRINLRIYKILKNSLFDSIQIIDTIRFSYQNQTNFSPQANNKTNFDCEAMICSNDSIYLFTKQWLNFKTSVYSIPKSKGNYVANFLYEYDVKGLVTGAYYNQEKHLVALCGYSSNLSTPFIYLLYDFSNKDFFSGNKRRLDLSLFAHQIEAITSVNSTSFYLTNENFTNSILQIKQQFHKVDLSNYINHYLTVNTLNDKKVVRIYPNPSDEKNEIVISGIESNSIINIIGLDGKIIKTYYELDEEISLEIEFLSKGIYFVEIINKEKIDRLKLIKN